MERKLRLANNIAILRHLVGESQEDLAFAMGLGGPSAIANYENNIREPDWSTIEKLARHFNVPVHTLMYVKLNEADGAKIYTNMLRNSGELWSVWFPFENMDIPEDPEYMQGLRKHRQMLATEYKDDARLRAEYDMAMDAYLSSFEKHNTFSSIVNALSLILLTYNQRAFLGEIKPEGNIPENGEWTRKIARLANPYMTGDSTEMQIVQEKKKLFSQGIHSICFTLMRMLKKGGYKWECYADYYWALLYVLNLHEHPCSPPEQASVGIHMLKDLCDLKNPYAQKAMELFYPD